MVTMAHALAGLSRRSGAVGIGLALVVALGACHHRYDPTADLAWAYPKGQNTAFGQSPGPGPFHMPGSALTLTATQLDQADGPVDWYPGDHPPAPAIVRGSPGSPLTSCAECHLFNGAGAPGSADLAGLPASYIIEQVIAFKSGERRSADPDQPGTAEMIKVARAVTPADLAQAATYFAGLPRPHWLHVVESAAVPRTIPDKFGWRDPAPGAGTEPIGDRVVELSDNLPQAFLNNDHVMITDYAPPGAVARGRAVVANGGSAGTACGTCHGAQLRGTTAVPPLAGRPAAYLARTLWDIRTGARHGPAVAQMQGPAKGLTPAEITDASAYLASLQP
jgi:cytochrome c553